MPVSEQVGERATCSLERSFHCERPPEEQLTDGDNWGDSDNRISRDLVREILAASELFAYVEVRPHGRASGLGTALAEVEAPHFRALRVADRQGVLGALDALFGDADE